LFDAAKEQNGSEIFRASCGARGHPHHDIKTIRLD
jgi:hypothetical protein